MIAGAERSVAALARRQHGLVARAQLIAAGVPAHSIDRRLQSGRLTAVHRGVYLVGGAVLSIRARELGATLAVGANATISHESAAYLQSLLPYPATYEAVDVTVTPRGPATRPGVRVHRASLAPSEWLVLDGIRVTTVARTLLDLSACSDPRTLERAVAQALATKRASRARLHRLASEHPGRNGVARLRALCEPGKPPSLTRSEAEERLLSLIRASELPDPLTNFTIGGLEVDLFWPDARLAIEVDGYEFHSGAQAYERDRLRDGRLAVLGIQVTRITWARIVGEPERLIDQLRQIRARRRT